MKVSVDPATIERRAYYKAWRENNKQRTKEYNARYWAKRAAKAKEMKHNAANENN